MNMLVMAITGGITGLLWPCLEHSGCTGRVLEALLPDTRGAALPHNAKCDTCGARYWWNGNRLTYLSHVPRP